MSIVFNLLFCIRAFLGQDSSIVKIAVLSLGRKHKRCFHRLWWRSRRVWDRLSRFLQFLTDGYSTVFLILGQHSQPKLRCNPMHVQLFCENSLRRFITNSNLCTEIVYGTTTILVNSRPYLFHFWGGVAVLGPPDRSSLAVEVLPFLKRPNHSKVRLRAHARITKSLFQHFKSFTSRFTQSNTELDARPLFVNFRHTADIRKSQTADAIHK